MGIKYIQICEPVARRNTGRAGSVRCECATGKRADLLKFLGDAKRQNGHAGGQDSRVFLAIPEGLAVFDPGDQ
ncbi:hypothetical protein [Celeribacter indicus]|uniref:hypothetical protein n=1 Tax=Celeribacter indicus TaxID=1208324 RepID=UPI001587F662|nr:hypothetical protein [Celeribacter indicus]